MFCCRHFAKIRRAVSRMPLTYPVGVAPFLLRDLRLGGYRGVSGALLTRGRLAVEQ
jgi:hypothetical protein